MKVTLNQTVKYGGKYHKPGETIDCKKGIADDLLKAGIATNYAPPVQQEEPQQDQDGDDQKEGQQENAETED